ncbi:MAG: SIMPL domain-containing protein [Bacteroidetes bacterium SW_9_63_38]|nr:MAG: SIMPL domain-containing protein [Bacteroidetes bacterium SW_9_63_38]
MRVLRWTGAFLVLGSFFVGDGRAQEVAEPPRTVRVSGENSVTVAPDQATVRFGIVSRAETAEEARRQNAEAAKSAMNAVRALDVPDEKMRMESLRLQPRREYNPETREHEEKGYEATRQAVVELSDLEQLPRLVTTVVQQGASRVDGISYGLSDRSSVRDEALRKAARRARDKAELLATTLEAELGPVEQIQEQSFGVDQPSPRVEMRAKAASSDAAPAPDAYAAGEIEVNATVQVTFVLR